MVSEPDSEPRSSWGVSDQGSGIFGYVNYIVEKNRKEILDKLLNGTTDSL